MTTENFQRIRFKKPLGVGMITLLEGLNPCGEIMLAAREMCSLWCPGDWPSYQERLDNKDCDD